MVTFEARRAVRGDYGHIHAGQRFSVNDWQAKQLEHLEAAGHIVRYTPRPPVERAAYTAYENKAVESTEKQQRFQDMIPVAKHSGGTHKRAK